MMIQVCRCLYTWAINYTVKIENLEKQKPLENLESPFSKICFLKGLMISCNRS